MRTPVSQEIDTRQRRGESIRRFAQLDHRRHFVASYRRCRGDVAYGPPFPYISKP